MTARQDAPAGVLLDTHALLWALTDPDRLAPHALAIVGSRRTDVVVSAASAWEISTKHRLGKLPQGDAIVAGWTRAIARLGGRELGISAEHALLAGRLDWAHRDPFDRVLAAQSMLEGLPLVTMDRAFVGLPGLRLLW